MKKCTTLTFTMQGNSNFCTVHLCLRKYFCLSCNCLFCSLCGHYLGHKETKQLPDFLLENFRILKIFGKNFFIKVSDRQNNQIYSVQIIENIDENTELILKSRVDKIISSNYGGIIKIYKYIYQKNEKFVMILMDYAEKNLKDLVNSIDDSQAANYFLKLCESIDYLHTELKIIHCNLSLKTILLRKNELKISNFWFNNYTHIKKHNSLFPPEILHCPAGPFNERTDIWSLGVLFHKMITKNTNPFLNEENCDQKQRNQKINENILTGKSFISPSIKNITFSKIIKGFFFTLLSSP